MKAKRVLLALFACLFAGASVAAPDITKGTWYGTDGTDGTLRGRDASGNPIGLLVGGAPNPGLKYVYDTRLDQTWLADWNANGPMNWADAMSWASSLKDFGGGWALPVVGDIGGDGCNGASFNMSDCGYNVYGGEFGRRQSPLAHMYYDTLGNLGALDVSGMLQSGWGLRNTGPFSNVQADLYWTAAGFPSADCGIWSFTMYDGNQTVSCPRRLSHFAVAIRPGDVAPIPEPSTVATMLVGLVLFAVSGRGRRHLNPL